MRMFGGTVRLATAAALVIFTTTAAAASPEDPQWKVISFQVALAVQNDGEVHVTETVVFDFGTAPGHGVTDPITLIPGYVDGATPKVSDVVVTNDDGASPLSSQTAALNAVTLRIGDPQATVTGVHSYHVAYTIAGAAYAVSGTDGQVALLWPVVNGDWDVPIYDTQVTLTMPGDVERVQCWGGAPTSADRCHEQSSQGAVATYKQPAIAAGQRFAVRAVSAVGAVAGLPAGDPIDYPSKGAAVSSGWSGGTTAIVLAVAALVVSLIFWVFRLRDSGPGTRIGHGPDASYPSDSSISYSGFDSSGSSGGDSGGGHGGGW